MFPNINRSLTSIRNISSPIEKNKSPQEKMVAHISQALTELKLSERDDMSLRGHEEEIARWLVRYGAKLAARMKVEGQAVDAKSRWFLPKPPINIRYVKGEDLNHSFVLGLGNKAFDEGAQKTIKVSVVVDWDPHNLDSSSCKVKQLVRSCLKLKGAKSLDERDVSKQVIERLKGAEGVLQARYYTRSQNSFNALSCHSIPKTKVYGLQERLENMTPDSFNFDGSRDALTTLQKMAKALGSIHDRGVVHNDIKPDNIMFDMNKNPVIIDLDLSDLAESKRKVVCGTPGFASPETFSSNRAGTNGQPADIYALGYTFDSLISQREPYDHPFYAGFKKQHAFWTADMRAHGKGLNHYLANKFDLALFTWKRSGRPVFACSESKTLDQLISDMTHMIPHCRPTARQVCEQLEILKSKVLPRESSDINLSDFVIATNGVRC